MKKKKNSLFIIDNCSSHLTAESFKLYDKEKIKVLYTSLIEAILI